MSEYRDKCKEFVNNVYKISSPGKRKEIKSYNFKDIGPGYPSVWQCAISLWGESFFSQNDVLFQAIAAWAIRMDEGSDRDFVNALGDVLQSQETLGKVIFQLVRIRNISSRNYLVIKNIDHYIARIISSRKKCDLGNLLYDLLNWEQEDVRLRWLRKTISRENVE